ncbi:MAG: DegT/DnrJ/EryC1/StrS family aminotransferase [Anaerolineales bacterium]|nr:DegT/DnrJ/EryC1/StrS family aminotransferase [Anaerolineales bacterium]MCW5855331.1 DegT/DnrJ/EryC1/StrS family aminotransferase [Anaerolineales bacterium]
MRVPMSSPSIGPAEQQAVAEVLATPVLSMGEQTTAFEEAVRHFSGAKHAISVNSGTAGLHLCVRAAGIGPGDLVLTTPFSFVSSSNVMLFEQAVPVFVDVDPLTGNLDPQALAQAAADLTAGGAAAQRWLPRRGVRGGQLKAILAVDIFGQPADFTSIRQTADQYGLPLIEDSCEALGAEYRGQLAGRLGDMGVYAFYPNKQITTGEGGVIITDDDRAADFMRALRNQGRAPGDTWLQHTHLGYNYRITELSAALGRVQMGRLEELLRMREQVAAWYQTRLQHQPGVELQYVAPDTTRMSWFVYAVRVAPGVDRDQLVQHLLAARIPSRPYFAPIHLQPFMIERFGYQAGDFPITEDLGNRGLAIPFSGVMTEEEVDIVCQELARALA